MANTCTAGHATRSEATKSATAGNRCSQLSSTTTCLCVPQVLDRVWGFVAVGCRCRVERADDRRRNQRGVAHGRQIDEDDAIGELIGHVVRHGERQARLA